MFPKLYFNTENKTILAYFLAISCLLHLILIFSSSSLSHFLTPEFNLSDYASKKDNYVIEIELESGKEEEKSIEDEEELKEEEEETEEDLPEVKRQLFVDTADKAIDEEPQADTERVGEKGSIARDMYAGEDNVNDEPRLESDADLPGDAPDDCRLRHLALGVDHEVEDDDAADALGQGLHRVDGLDVRLLLRDGNAV